MTKWLKAEGDEINEYDAILELSTDSLYAPGDAPVEGAAVDMVIELAESGYVGKLLVAEGETVEVSGDIYPGDMCVLGTAAAVDVGVVCSRLLLIFCCRFFFIDAGRQLTSCSSSVWVSVYYTFLDSSTRRCFYDTGTYYVYFTTPGCV